MRTSASTSILAISLLLFSLAASAKKKEEPIPQAPFFCGAAVQADLSGPVMKAIGTKFNNLEIGARLNFRDHYFPIAELGIGEGNREGQENDNTFHTRAPFFRVGMDYNICKKHNGNRFFVGVRYGFARYKYDFKDPTFGDDVWGEEHPLELTNQQAHSHWGEGVIGCETKLWSFVRLGWNLRYKFRLKQKVSEYGEPWFTPGYGRNGGSVFGGTVNLIFDVGKTTKKADKKKTTKK